MSSRCRERFYHTCRLAKNRRTRLFAVQNNIDALSRVFQAQCVPLVPRNDGDSTSALGEVKRHVISNALARAT
jgi:hypothetical protein